MSSISQYPCFLYVDTIHYNSSMNLSIALAQLQVASGDFLRNTTRAMDFISRAVNHNSEIILFPELWTAGFDYSDCHSYSLANCEFLDDLQKTADDKGIAIGGSYLIEEDHKFFNQFILLQPGLPRLTYNKIHLFHLMEEDAHLSPGNRVSICPTHWGALSLAVCYDLRFPEMFRLAREKEAILMVMSAGWPNLRIEHWKTLVRARAIENQCFFAAVNCVGGDEKVPYGGCSAVVGPWGETIAEADGRQEELIHAVIDLDEVSRVREKYPFFDDRLVRYSD
ncbi:MAG: nitrilase-related carbon-nitrogen hydrolase [Anaerolineaceae bacterium]